MSEYSGKCDLWDSLVMIREANDDTDWNKIKIYRHTPETEFTAQGFINEEKLEIHSLKDLIPYAPYLVCASYGDSDGNYVAHISRKSFVDSEEAEHLDWMLKEWKKRYNRCRRKKIDFNPEDYINDSFYKDIELEIGRRVKEHPSSAKTDGMHLPLCKYYRERLIDDMIKYGYTKDEAESWVYSGIKKW